MATEPQTTTAAPPPPPFTDNPNIAETFADALQSVGIGNGVITLTFAVTRTEDGKPPRLARSTAARLVLPFPAAIELLQKLNAVLTALQQQAAAASAPAADPAAAAKGKK
jgi:hypothetical protein